MNKPVIKAILFDLDDTLWEIQPVLVRAEALLYQWLSTHTPNIAAVHTIESLREHRMTLARDNPAFKVNLIVAFRHCVDFGMQTRLCIQQGTLCIGL